MIQLNLSLADAKHAYHELKRAYDYNRYSVRLKFLKYLDLKITQEEYPDTPLTPAGVALIAEFEPPPT